MLAHHLHPNPTSRTISGKTPYNFDFLALGATLARHLERGLLDHPRQFLLPLGQALRLWDAALAQQFVPVECDPADLRSCFRRNSLLH